MKVAVEGCCHGELDTIYASLQRLEAREGVTIDLLLCCGDFQAVRNADDLACMSVPDKYKVLGSFYKYYTGEAVAPYPTLFVGGNHEAANYLWELYYGGWVCPNIYFLGYAGVVRFGDLRIGGLSGIWKFGDYRRGYTERPPYSPADVKSAYHVREYEVWKLRQLAEPLDVFLSHDWPRGVAAHGDAAGLCRAKPFLADELRDGSLGSAPNAELLAQLAPDYWFAAHLHCKFAGLVPRPGGRPGATRFLALDKCLPRRDFLQVVDLPHRTAGPFSYDPEWLAIIAASHALMPLTRAPAALPAGGRGPAPGLAAAQAAVAAALVTRGGAEIPVAFAATVAAHDPARPRRPAMPTGTPRNPQTLHLLELLGLDYKLDGPAQWSGPLPPPPPPVANPEEIELDVGDEELELPDE